MADNEQWREMMDWLWDQGAKCLWASSPRNCQFTLECFSVGTNLVIFQIWKRGGFEIYSSHDAPRTIDGCKAWLLEHAEDQRVA